MKTNYEKYWTLKHKVNDVLINVIGMFMASILMVDLILWIIGCKEMANLIMFGSAFGMLAMVAAIPFVWIIEDLVLEKVCKNKKN